MRYDYSCSECGNVFETSHKMNEKPKIPCPKCKSTKTAVAFNTIAPFYIKGNGYLDREGVRRDMNLHKLVNDDPYGYMRQRGEKEDLIQKLKRGGKRQKNPKNFVMSKKK